MSDETVTSPLVAAWLDATCVSCGAARDGCRVKRHHSGRACCPQCHHDDEREARA